MERLPTPEKPDEFAGSGTRAEKALKEGRKQLENEIAKLQKQCDHGDTRACEQVAKKVHLRLRIGGLE